MWNTSADLYQILCAYFSHLSFSHLYFCNLSITYHNNYSWWLSIPSLFAFPDKILDEMKCCWNILSHQSHYDQPVIGCHEPCQVVDKTSCLVLDTLQEHRQKIGISRRTEHFRADRTFQWRRQDMPGQIGHDRVDRTCQGGRTCQKSLVLETCPSLFSRLYRHTNWSNL